MTKVRVHDKPASPAADLIAKATAEASVTDKRGRVIALRKPGVLAQYRLVEILGDTASNMTYVRMVAPLIFVSSIDGEPVLLQSKAQIEALIEQLGEEGLEAVNDGVSANFTPPDEVADRAAVKK